MNSNKNKANKKTLALKIAAFILATVFVVSAMLLVVELFDNNPMYADIYNLVLSKKWTIDTMLKMATSINVDVDDDPRACYFRQVAYGKYMREALLLKLLEVEE